MLFKISRFEGIIFELLDKVFPSEEEHIRKNFIESFFRNVLGEEEIAEEIVSFCTGEIVTVEGINYQIHPQKKKVIFKKGREIMIVPESKLERAEKEKFLNFFLKKGET